MGRSTQESAEWNIGSSYLGGIGYYYLTALDSRFNYDGAGLYNSLENLHISIYSYESPDQRKLFDRKFIELKKYYDECVTNPNPVLDFQFYQALIKIFKDIMLILHATKLLNKLSQNLLDPYNRIFGENEPLT